VIVRQRPGTARGFCFLTLEDETGVSNAVIVPAQFQRYRSVIHRSALLEVEGPLQVVDGVIHVRARRLRELALPDRSVRQEGRGYRMRTVPTSGSAGGLADGDRDGDGGDPAKLPKSHDFR